MLNLTVLTALERTQPLKSLLQVAPEGLARVAFSPLVSLTVPTGWCLTFVSDPVEPKMRDVEPTHSNDRPCSAADFDPVPPPPTTSASHDLGALFSPRSVISTATTISRVRLPLPRFPRPSRPDSWTAGCSPLAPASVAPDVAEPTPSKAMAQLQQEVLEWESGCVTKLQVQCFRGTGKVSLLTEDQEEGGGWQQGEFAMRWVEANRRALKHFLPSFAVERKGMDMVVDLVGLHGKRGGGWDLGASTVLAMVHALTSNCIKRPDRTVVMAGLDGADAQSGLLMHGLGPTHRVPHAAALVQSLVKGGCSRVVVAQGVADSLREAAEGAKLEVVGVRLVEEVLALLMPGVLQRPLVLRLDNVIVYRAPPGHVRA